MMQKMNNGEFARFLNDTSLHTREPLVNKEIDFTIHNQSGGEVGVGLEHAGHVEVRFYDWWLQVWAEMQ